MRASVAKRKDAGTQGIGKTQAADGVVGLGATGGTNSSATSRTENDATSGNNSGATSRTENGAKGGTNSSATGRRAA